MKSLNKTLRPVAALLLVAVLLISCEKPIITDDELQKTAADSETTQPDGTPMPLVLQVEVPQECQRLNVMLFDSLGSRAFSKVKTQMASEQGFGTMGLNVADGTYTVVAVAHSSPTSATIKSPQAVQFTIQDGRKVTATYAACRQVVVGEPPTTVTLPLHVATAQVAFVFNDQPTSVDHVTFAYEGGSANFSPMSMLGITKSKQTETRAFNVDGTYSVWTFPYMADDGVLTMTITASASDGSPIRERTLPSVPVHLGGVTLLRGAFFADGPFPAPDFGFQVNDEWEGDTIIYF